MQETWVRALGWEDALEKATATDFSILAWGILMDRGVWWATVHGVAKNWTQLYGVAQSRTRLKRLSSSSSSRTTFTLLSVSRTKLIFVYMYMISLLDHKLIEGGRHP